MVQLNREFYMHNHAPKNYICPFCLLIQGIKNEHVYSIQSDVIFQNDTVTAFVSSHQWPNNHGNAIVVPNQHFENIYDLPLRYALDIQRVAKHLAIAMKNVYLCDGISTRQHNEPAGSQDVWHYHLHITPRYKDDNYYGSQREFMPIVEREKHANALKKSLLIIEVNE
jgi:histidine triad (HIT) family protein